MGYIARGKAWSSYVLSSDNLSPSTYSRASENFLMFVILYKNLKFYDVIITMVSKLLIIWLKPSKVGGLWVSILIKIHSQLSNMTSLRICLSDIDIAHKQYHFPQR